MKTPAILLGVTALALVLNANERSNGTASARQSGGSLEEFNTAFKTIIAEAHRQKIEPDQFNNPGEVGWQTVVITGNTAAQITVFLSPPSTFAFKHLCVGDANSHPATLMCQSNLSRDSPIDQRIATSLVV